MSEDKYMIYLFINDILEINEKKYRIIGISNYSYCLIELDTFALNVIVISLEDLENDIKLNYVKLVNNSNESKIVDIDKISEKSRKMLDLSMLIISDFLAILPSVFILSCREKAQYIKTIAKKHNISVPTMYKYVRLYYQGGMSRTALLNNYCNCGAKGKKRNYSENKPGPKSQGSQVVLDQELIDKFEIMRKRYLSYKCRISRRALYEEFVFMFYTEKLENDSSGQIKLSTIKDIPSQRQLDYYIDKKLDKVKVYKAKYGEKESMNNIRPLLGDTIHNNLGAGHIFEMDEVETDYYLVSKVDRTKILGRAIMYVIHDTFSKSIAGISVGFDNNSWQGASAALFNMIEDKTQYCKKFGILIEKNQWPISNGIPQIIRVDNGSEYVSKKFTKMAQEMNVIISYVPTRQGSKKPNVEQVFRQFNLRMNERVPGQIYKEYNSNHKHSAALDIIQFTKLAIQFTLYYNNRIMKNYPLSKEMICEQLVPTPLNIWNYSLRRNGYFRMITSLDQVKFMLLQDGMANVTREGIIFNGLYYIAEDIDWLKNEMSKAAIGSTRLKKLEIRYDSRNVNQIYYVLDNRINIAYLNSAKSKNAPFFDCSWSEVDLFNIENKEKIKGYDFEQLKHAIDLNVRVKSIVDEAQKSKVKKTAKSIKNVRLNRKEEKVSFNPMQAIVIKRDNEILAENKSTMNSEKECELQLTGNSKLDFFRRKRVEDYYE